MAAHVALMCSVPQREDTGHPRGTMMDAWGLLHVILVYAG